MKHTVQDHERYMRIAIEQARRAESNDEVPVGAVLVDAEGRVIASAANHTISLCDPTAHAEILVLRKAAARMKNYRLLSTTLYVTVEPCVMCMGAIVHSRVARLVFGTPDPKWGAAGSLYHFDTDNRLNHQVKVVSGICLEDCKSLMQNFFRQKRKKTD